MYTKTWEIAHNSRRLYYLTLNGVVVLDHMKTSEQAERARTSEIALAKTRDKYFGDIVKHISVAR